MNHEAAEALAETTIENRADDPVTYDLAAIADAILNEYEDTGEEVTEARAQAIMEDHPRDAAEIAAIRADMREQEQFDWAHDDI